MFWWRYRTVLACGDFWQDELSSFSFTYLLSVVGSLQTYFHDTNQLFCVFSPLKLPDFLPVCRIVVGEGMVYSEASY